MPFDITPEQIAALAPDRASAQAGERLAQRRSWQNTGHNGQAVWGECQGSAAKPYRVQIDFAAGAPASRCSCPSRKLPCKHAMGLLLLLANDPQHIPSQTPPEWAERWFASRRTKIEAAHNNVPQPAKAGSSNRRAASRDERVAAGMGDLRRWLHDLVRQGLAAAQQQPYSYWEQAAARLIDAQAPGLARQVRALPGVVGSGRGWQERLLERLARLHLLIEGWNRITTLPEDVQADLRGAIGWTWSRDELLQRPATEDRWSILGRHSWEDDGLRTQRTWLYSQTSSQFALILDFAPAHQPIDRTLVPGTTIDASVVFYPSATPLRALVGQQHGTPQRLAAPAGDSIEVALARYTAAVARNPWTEQFPLLLHEVTPVHTLGNWLVRARNGLSLPLAPRFERGWQLAALSGGQPIPIFGEWDGGTLLPLGCWADDTWLSLGEER